jgi:hypothetical protein
MYVAVGGAGLQQPIAKIARSEITHWYQHLIYANERFRCFATQALDAANLAAFCSVCAFT